MKLQKDSSKPKTRLAEVMERKGVKPYDLARAVGLKTVPLGIHRAYNGLIRAGNLPYNTLRFLADQLDEPIDNLVEEYESNGQEYKTNQSVCVVKRLMKKLDLLENTNKETTIYSKSFVSKEGPTFCLVENDGLHSSIVFLTYENGRILMHKADIVDEEFSPHSDFKIVDLTGLFIEKINQIKELEKTSSLEREKLMENKNNNSGENGGTNNSSGNTLDSLEGNFQNSEKNKSGEEIKEEKKVNPVFSPLPIDFKEDQRKYFIRSDMFIPEFMLDLDAIYQDADLSQYASDTMESIDFFKSLYNQLQALGVK